MQPDSDFDPYHKWLGIPLREQPPNHYRLLGLEPFESDPEVICTAADQRTAYLRECSHGPHATRANELVNHVAAARSCLIDTARKSVYDAQLRSVIAPHGAAAEHVSQPLPEPVAPVAFEHVHQEPVPIPFDRPIKPRKTRNDGLSVVIGAVLGGPIGLAAGYLVLCLLVPEYDVLGIFTTRQVANSAPAGATSLDSNIAPRQQSLDSPPEEPSEADPAGVEDHKADAAAEQVPEPPSEQPPPPSLPQALDPFRDIPSAIHLPDFRGAQHLEPVGMLHVPAELRVAMRVLNPKQGLDYDFEIHEDPLRPGAIEWQVDAVQPKAERFVRSVGRFSLQGDTLHFAWTDDINPEFGAALRNCVLHVTVGDAERKMPLRTPVQVPAIPLDFVDKIPPTKVDLEGLPPAVSKMLILKVGSVEGIPIENMAELESPQRGKTKTRVALDQGNPQMQLRLRLQNGEDLYPELLLFTAGPLQPFSDRRVEQTLKKARDEQRSKVLAKKHDLDQAERDREKDPQNGFKLQQKIDKLKVEIKELSKNLSPLDAQWDHLQSLYKLAEDLRGKAKLHVRLYYVCEGTKVDVWRAGDVFPELREAEETPALAEAKAKKSKRPDTFVNSRQPKWRRELLETYGGNDETEVAVSRALAWLAEHQRQDGSWDLGLSAANCGCRNHGRLENAPIAATALALLPFLGAGHASDKGAYKSNVDAGLRFLMRKMKGTPNGGDWTEPGSRMYAHGLASIALSEAYAVTNDFDIGAAAQQAVNFIVYAQDPNGGGWRYAPREGGDTSVTGWQVMGLRAALLAGLTVPEETLVGARKFLASVQEADGAAYGYTGPERRLGTTAIGLLCRMHLDGWKRVNSALQRGVEFVALQGPSSNNIYFDYYATQLLFQYGGEPWAAWNKQVRDMLLKAQSVDGHERGSWFAGGDDSSEHGGRLYYTSMAALTLETYYRYPRLNQEPEKSPVAAPAPPAKQRADRLNRQTIVTAGPGNEPPKAPGDVPSNEPSELLRAAREAMSLRDVEQAEKLLEQAEFEVKGDKLKAALDREKQLYHFIRGFWNAVRGALATKVKATTELMIDGEEAIVVDFPDMKNLKIKGKGEEETHSIADLPTSWALGLADLWFDKSPAVMRDNKVFIGTFLVLDARGDRKRGLQTLHEAKDAGSEDAALVLKYLDDK